jgi:hypothetical protein
MASNVNINQNLSNNSMEHLLESLHEEDEDPATIIKKIKAENKLLKNKLEEVVAELAKRNKSQVSIKLNQSLAYQQQQQANEKRDKSVLLNQDSMLEQSKQDGASFYSISQSIAN